MKVDRLLSRFRSFADYLADPIKREGSIYRGTFRLEGRHVEGSVWRFDGSPLPSPPDAVTIAYSGDVIGTIKELTGGPPRWQFKLDTGFDITTSDVLQDRFTVFAVNNLGRQFVLQADGRMQVGYIQGTRDRESDVELTIEFTQDGNAGPYLREGWCNRERKFTWTQGKVSFMEIPVKEPQADYQIEMHLRPFIVPAKLPSQDLDVYVNGSLVSRSSLRGADKPVTFVVPKDLVVDQSMKLRFDLPDACRPSDLIPDHKNNRVLAIAFEKLVLARRLNT
jgi:hypothetical protein